MTITKYLVAGLALSNGFPFSSQAQAQGMEGMEMPAPKPEPKAAPQTAPAPSTAMPGMQMPQAGSSSTASGTGTPSNSTDRRNWPSPTIDDAKRSYLLFDNFEYRRVGGENALVFDILGWQGGDYNRTWFKSEGSQSLSRRGRSNAEVQLLRGKLISPYFDLQYGVRVAGQYGAGPNRSRVYAAIGLQGLSPYRFDIEPTLFLSQQGKLSGSFTGTYDVLLSQKLILQPRFETSFALQKDEAFGVGSGLNDAELGLRLRYEIRRDFAPYVGVSYGRSFGGTRSLLRRAGESTNQSSIVAGVRLIF